MRHRAQAIQATRIAAVTSALLLGCTLKAEERREVPIPDLVVTATDFSFAAPDTIAAGLRRVRLVNLGESPHHVQLLRLDDTTTVDQVLDRAQRDELVMPGVTYMGGPDLPPDGSEGDVVMDLAPGRYLMLCYMPMGKVRHLAMGMTRQLVVVPGGRDEARLPVADAHMVLDSYSFRLMGELTAGRRVIRVENVSQEPHEVFLAQVPAGRSAKEVLQWLQKKAGPPPFLPAGGTLMLSRGRNAYVSADLVAGEYVLMCFVPDSRDGKPHIAHGMVRAITVSSNQAVNRAPSQPVVDHR